ncbi:hypothetical protein I6F18_20015 [Bradyrhizobium sp. NBAIM32]|uniref:hypothetical protein n=1 Tax=Bradyrhizobium sp. NBAIM32 TaxID=2793809 RepID=UPI001CD5A5E6|nr:hypothetical protein [Bradyrhizobium sp. NBAIM32]MCA1542247.1 hypothetical protein [Bradyrhizobium sp. NBAIM32]
MRSMAQWHPINENHAIDVMAAIVNFAEPVPDLLLKRVVKSTEDLAFASGLRSRHTFQQPFLSIINGQAAVQQAPQVQGRIYNSIVEGPPGEPLSSRIAEQVQVTQGFLAYRTWQYVSWNWQLERIRALLGSALSMVVGSVLVGNIRLEYLDRFYFDGTPDQAAPDLVLRKDSPYVAPHVFSRRDLWHSHTGAFLPGDNKSKRLEQVHIDALDQPGANTENIRCMNLMTAREDRYIEVGDDQSAEEILASFDAMHDDLIKLLGEVVTKDIAGRIYLTNGAEP